MGPEAFLLANQEISPIQATVSFDDGSSYTDQEDCSWSIDGSEARIYRDGSRRTVIESLYTGDSTVSRTITVNCLGSSNTANLILTPNTATSLVLNPASGKVAVGETASLQAPNFDDGGFYRCDENSTLDKL